MIYKLAKNDFKTKYAGSYLGIIWAFIQPVITVLVYWFVFEVGFRGGSDSLPVPFVLYLVAGIIPWFFFQDGLTGGTNSLLEYSYLVKKSYSYQCTSGCENFVGSFCTSVFYRVYYIFVLLLWTLSGSVLSAAAVLSGGTASAYPWAFVSDERCGSFFPGSVADDQHCASDRDLADTNHVGSGR